jgi:ADP-ribose pyrophosphatase
VRIAAKVNQTTLGIAMGNSQNWKLLSRKSLREFRVVSVQEHMYEHVPPGKQRGYVVCDSADCVFTIPVTPDNKIVFIRQFRHGRGEVVLEIPGGVMDPGETPETTGLRELKEETGYVPESVEMFGPLLPNPGLDTAQYHIALARNCRPLFPPAPEPSEEIKIELRPLESVSEMISSCELTHALCIAAFAVTKAHRTQKDDSTSAAER